MPVRCVRVCGGIRAADTAPADLLQLRQVTNLWVFYIACAYIPPPPTAEPLFLFSSSYYIYFGSFFSVSFTLPYIYLPWKEKKKEI